MTELVQLTKDNDIAIITINNPPVNALSPGVPEGISEALDRIAQGRQRQSRGTDRRRPYLRRRRGHQRIRQDDLLGQIARRRAHSVPLENGRQHQAGNRSDSWNSFRRRIGTGDGRPLSRCCFERASRPARSEARSYPRRGGHAAPSEARRRGEGRRNVHERQSGEGGRSAEVRHHRPHHRRRSPRRSG